MGMKYCKIKIPRFRKTLLQVVISFPVFKRIRKKLDNELWSVERSGCTAKHLGQISKPENDQEILSILTTGIDNSL